MEDLLDSAVYGNAPVSNGSEAVVHENGNGVIDLDDGSRQSSSSVEEVPEPSTVNGTADSGRPQKKQRIDLDLTGDGPSPFPSPSLASPSGGPFAGYNGGGYGGYSNGFGLGGMVGMQSNAGRGALPNGMAPSVGMNMSQFSAYPPSMFPNMVPQPSVLHQQPVASTSYAPALASTSSQPIDLTSDQPFPSTSAQPAPSKHNEKQAVLIGSIDTQALVLYPVPLMQQGENSGQLLAQNEVRIDGGGEEWLKVKMKFRKLKPPYRLVSTETSINVGNLKSSIQVAALNETLLGIMGPLMQKGLARFEGWIKRGDTEKMYIATLNILVFTLPSNISYISNHFANNSIQLDVPFPYYDPKFYSDTPRYQNPHNPPPEGFRAQRKNREAALNAAHSLTMGFRSSQMKTVEVQREQVDHVFRSLKGGDELHETQPGPLIKTPLFPHQLKAITFLQQREAEPSAIKAALAAQPTLETEGVEVVETNLTESEKKRLKKIKKRQDKLAKMKGVNSLWEPIVDTDGKVREWKNLVTEVIETGKEKPKEARGAILADDMGLGKTLTVISLVASTWDTSKRFQDAGLQAPDSDDESASDASDLSVSHFEGTVFGMPDSRLEDLEESTSGNKKRKRAENLKFNKKKILRLEHKARLDRLKRRSSATLLVCPLTTLSNWEDQIKEHWSGSVDIVNGFKRAGEKDIRIHNPSLRVYVYHGPNRISDVDFLAGFDIVITTFTTLQTEYSRQLRTAEGTSAYQSGASSSAGERDDTPGAKNEEEFYEEIDEDGNVMVKGSEKPEIAAERLMLQKTGKGKKGVIDGVDLMGRKTAKEAISPLQAIEWFRIVLDEAHFIKDSNTIAAKAACYLEAERRICLTGTPIQNKLDDVWALLKFIRLTPWDEKEVWQKYIMSLAKQGVSTGIVRLQTVLKHCTLRRTKESTNSEGKKILNLPARTTSNVSIKLSEAERKIYDDNYVKSKKDFDRSLAEGGPKISMVNILQELLRLRMICDHWELIDHPDQDDVEEDLLELGDVDLEEAQQILTDQGVNLRRAFAVVLALKESDALRCQHCTWSFDLPKIVKDEVDDDAPVQPVKGKGKKPKAPLYPILTKCCHVFCIACFQKNVYQQWPKSVKGVGRMCSLCNTGLALGRDVIEVSPGSTTANEAAEGPRSKAAKKRRGNEDVVPSSKMQALMNDLVESSTLNPASTIYNPEASDLAVLDENGKPVVTKSVVFSQWTSMLDKIELMLDKVQIKYCRIDGTMRRDARAEAMDTFKNDLKTEVILVSLRAGGVGLNLTTASRCYLMDPYWNPSVENQAVDRIHRLGQTRPVTAIKYIVEDSIEEKMLVVQKRKADLAALSLSQTLSKKELHDRKMEDLKTLFT